MSKNKAELLKDMFEEQENIKILKVCKESLIKQIQEKEQQNKALQDNNAKLKKEIAAAEAEKNLLVYELNNANTNLSLAQSLPKKVESICDILIKERNELTKKLKNENSLLEFFSLMLSRYKDFSGIEITPEALLMKKLSLNQLMHTNLLENKGKNALITIEDRINANIDKHKVFLLAAQCGRLDVIEKLVNERVDINFQDIDGNTALHIVIAEQNFISRCKKPKIIKYLLKNGADSYALNNNHKTSIDFAKMFLPEMVYRLEHSEDLFTYEEFKVDMTSSEEFIEHLKLLGYIK